MMKHRKKKLFWQIYGLVVVAVAFFLVAGLLVFYDYMAAYEASQPQNAADLYVAELDEGKVMTMVEKCISSLDMQNDDPSAYAEMYRKAWKDNSVICRKDLVNGTSDKPVFSVICGELEVCRLTLGKSDKSDYGFAVWEVVSALTPPDAITKNAKDYSVYAPVGASLAVNGKTVTPTETSVKCPLISKLESEERGLFSLYKLGTYYSEPVLECTGIEGECVKTERSGTVMYTPFGTDVKDYTITVPTGAVVTVNEVVLDESFISERDVPCSYSKYEKDTGALPTKTVYRTGGLYEMPSVLVMNGDEELKTEMKGTDVSANAPMYSLTIKVPEGASVEINGVAVTETPEKENLLDGLVDTLSQNVPTFDVYSISGLFAPVTDVKGILDSAELEFFSGTTGAENGYTQLYTAHLSTSVDENVAAFATDYVKAYFHYAYQGFRNTAANLAAALAYIEQGTELYSDVQRSKIGFDFQTPVSSLTYNQFGATDMFVLDDGSYVVKVVYDVVENYSGIIRPRAGEISLRVVNTDAGLKIAAMVIDKK